MNTATWVPWKMNVLGFTLRVTPGIGDAAESVTLLGVGSNLLIMME
jgi:hypothetical protein